MMLDALMGMVPRFMGAMTGGMPAPGGFPGMPGPGGMPQLPGGLADAFSGLMSGGPMGDALGQLINGAGPGGPGGSLAEAMQASRAARTGRGRRARRHGRGRRPGRGRRRGAAHRAQRQHQIRRQAGPRPAEAPAQPQQQTPAPAPATTQAPAANPALAGKVDWPLSAAETARVLNVPLKNVQENLPHLLQAFAQAGITDRQTVGGLLAVSARESGMKPVLEIASGRAYEGMRNIGNVHPGDGVRYKGRGFIQLTGRSNYEHYGKALGVDLVNHPDLAMRPDIAARIAARYAIERGMPAKIHAGNLDGFRRAVGAGPGGIALRTFRHDYTALQAALRGR